MNTSQELLTILENWGTSESPNFTTCTTDQLDLPLTLNDFEINLMRESNNAQIATLPQNQSKFQEDSAQFLAMDATADVAENRDFTAAKFNNAVSGGKDHRPPPNEEAFPPLLPKRRYRGVYLRPNGRFVSEISKRSLKNSKGRTRLHLGTFDTAEQAAMAFDQASFQLRGSDAVLNFPDLIENQGSTSYLSPEISRNLQLFLSSQDQQPEGETIKSTKKKSTTRVKQGTFSHEALQEIFKKRWSSEPLRDAHIQPSLDTHNYENFKDDDDDDKVINFDEMQNMKRYRGVRLWPSGKFSASINTRNVENKKKKLWLGMYDTAEQAAEAYDQASFLARGSNAVLNFPDLIDKYMKLSPWTM